MRKPRQFRPVVAEAQLEERVVLSVSAAQLPAVLLAPVRTPVATSAGATAALNGLHNALLGYQSSVTNAVLFAESQITSGKVTAAAAENLLNSYLFSKTSLLFFQSRIATGNLPYGSGFNGYLNSTSTAVGELPSGSLSLYSVLSFPSQTTSGPLGTLQNNVFNSISRGDFAGAITDVNSTAIHSTYATIKNDVTAYIAAGVKAHDFTFRA